MGAFALATLIIVAGCGGSDALESVQDDADPVENEEATPDEDDTSSTDTAAGFGELMEGSFILSGAVEEQFDVSDDQFAFRTGGGCQDGVFGFSIQVNDTAGTTTYAIFNALIQEDLSGGVTGEYDDVDFDVSIFPDGDMSLGETYDGPVKMIISEHDTGGVDADLNARRMTVTLLGSVPSDAGDVDVDITHRWVMGCP